MVYGVARMGMSHPHSLYGSEGAAMLSDTERRRLAEIEFWFEANDPRLVRRFAGRQGRRPYRRLAIVALVVVAVAVAIVVGFVAGDPPAGIVAGLTVVAMAFGLWMNRRSTSPPR
jgi:hypothetical protein